MQFNITFKKTENKHSDMDFTIFELWNILK